MYKFVNIFLLNFFDITGEQMGNQKGVTYD